MSKIEVIQHSPSSPEEIVFRYPQDGTTDIKIGAQLIVQENQEAVFFRDGKALDTFGPGRHTLATLNLPLVTRILTIPWEKSPFQANVVFVNRKTFINRKWGTKEPVLFRDKELSLIRLRSFGTYSLRVQNSQVFVNEIVGGQGLYHTEELEDFYRDVIAARLADVLGENLKTIFDLPQFYDEMGTLMKSRLGTDFSKHGVELVDFLIASITPPDEVLAKMDERAGMGAVGDLNAYMKFKAAQAMQDAAKSSGGGGVAAAGVGMGAGVGLGMAMPQMLQQAMASGGAAAGSAVPCPKCNAAVPAGSKFCPACGAVVPAMGMVPCPSCGKPMPTAAKFCPECGKATSAACPKCGKLVAVGAKFCPECGAKI
jgi:membrane protease subunit (stomatin/prohibitin family)